MSINCDLNHRIDVAEQDAISKFKGNSTRIKKVNDNKLVLKQDPKWKFNIKQIEKIIDSDIKRLDKYTNEKYGKEFGSWANKNLLSDGVEITIKMPGSLKMAYRVKDEEISLNDANKELQKNNFITDFDRRDAAKKEQYEIDNNLTSEIFYQNNTNQSTEDYVASEKTIRDLAARMSDRIGIPVRFESDRTKKYKGKLENDVAYINLAYATLDTAVHEVLGHSIIRALKNKSKLSSKEQLNQQIEQGNIEKKC